VTIDWEVINAKKQKEIDDEIRQNEGRGGSTGRK
jgi:hypothetical protein